MDITLLNESKNSLKFQGKICLIDRLKHVEHKIICICIDVYKIYESTGYDKIYEALSKLEKKLKFENNLIEKYKGMNEYPDFAQNYYSRTSTGIYKIGHDSSMIKKWFA